MEHRTIKTLKDLNVGDYIICEFILKLNIYETLPGVYFLTNQFDPKKLRQRMNLINSNELFIKIDGDINDVRMYIKNLFRLLKKSHSSGK